MFRTITSSVDKRRAALKQGAAQQQTVDRIIQEFMETVFGPNSRHIEIAATLKEGNLFIQTQNKTAANEIVFHSGALYRFLKERGITYRQIVIR